MMATKINLEVKKITKLELKRFFHL